jgi:hypothetical protein
MSKVDGRVCAAEREIAEGIQALGDLWVLLDSALDNGTEGAACSIAIELLPVIGGRLDNAMTVLGMSPTGCFEDALANRGIMIGASGDTFAEARHG